MVRLLKSAFKISQIKVMLCSQHGEVLNEQILTSSDRITHAFRFEFTDDFPDYDILKVITDELGDHEYTIHKEDIKTGLLNSFACDNSSLKLANDKLTIHGLHVICLCIPKHFQTFYDGPCLSRVI